MREVAWNCGQGGGSPILPQNVSDVLNGSPSPAPLQWCNRDPRCKKLQLTDLLVSPVHHIMKIPLVIRDIEARTESPEEKAVIAKALEMKEASLSELQCLKLRLRLRRLRFLELFLATLTLKQFAQTAANLNRKCRSANQNLSYIPY